MKDKILIFIDQVVPKNKLQVEALAKCGLQAHFFVYQKNQSVEPFLSPSHSQSLLTKNPIVQIFRVFHYMKKHRTSIHHIEIYPGSILSFAYLFIAKFFKLKCICVERGDLNYYMRGGYSVLTRASMWCCYYFSDVVWYRETFMKPLLKKIGAKRLFFLHNAVETPTQATAEMCKRPVNFLWLNRILRDRRSDWFIEVLKTPAFAGTKNVLAGIIADSKYKREQDFALRNKPANIAIQDFSEKSRDLILQSRFFVLPAEKVFANHALLEAMSCGVVPIVSRQAGTDLIITDGTNGFVFPHTFEDFRATMEKALNLSEQDWNKMSAAAAEKIRVDFSREKYFAGIAALYSLPEVSAKTKYC